MPAEQSIRAEVMSLRRQGVEFSAQGDSLVSFMSSSIHGNRRQARVSGFRSLQVDSVSGGCR